MGDLVVTATQKGNRLAWETYSEVNSRGFHILRSRNGKDFVEVGYVDAAGQSSTKRAYSYTDQASTSRVYYKVRFEGTEEGDVAYSNVVTVAPVGVANFRLYPNPAQGQLFVEMDEAEAETTTLRITDAQGKVYPVEVLPSTTGAYQMDIQHLSAGIYVVEKVSQGAVIGKARVVKY
jgi:hypothetical protein